MAKGGNGGGGCALVIGGALVLGALIKYWYVAVPIIVIVFICCWISAGNAEKTKAAARAVLEAEQADRAHQAELESAQLQHHLDRLSHADPVYSQLMADLRAVPPTRPIDRARVEKSMAARYVVIDQFAHEFADLERNGQPVPDHAATMRGLVEQEYAWDTRSNPGRHRT